RHRSQSRLREWWREYGPEQPLMATSFRQYQWFDLCRKRRRRHPGQWREGASRTIGQRPSRRQCHRTLISPGRLRDLCDAATLYAAIHPCQIDVYLMTNCNWLQSLFERSTNHDFKTTVTLAKLAHARAE